QEIRDSVKISENATLLELELEFDLSSSTANDFGFILKNTKGEKVIVGFQKTDSTFYIDRTNSGKASFSDKFARVDSAPYIPQGMMKIRALIDVASVEVFVDDGRLAMTEIYFPNEDYTQTQLFSNGGDAALTSGKAYRLKSIW
ncbi:MAG TPA: GH32 C-terminal domain-containing protein, partial [Saprospiraceae bacterium]|nr:GH32 C-terminal domain-containing protein [Saprospiraceae bacterium]